MDLDFYANILFKKSWFTVLNDYKIQFVLKNMHAAEKFSFTVIQQGVQGEGIGLSDDVPLPARHGHSRVSALNTVVASLLLSLLQTPEISVTKLARITSKS